MNPNCLRCGHPFDSHKNDETRTCKRQTLTGWDERAKQFKSRENCECDGYLGRVPTAEPGKRGCPHELLDGSRVCVVCKEPIPAKVKR